MTQAYEEVMEMKSPKVEEIPVKSPKECEVDELIGDLNPRYFEEVKSLKEAKTWAYTKDVNVGSKYNFFSAF